MKSEKLIAGENDYVALAHRIERCPDIQTLDHDDHKEAWVLAHALMDLEESFRAFLNDRLPNLLAADDPDAICDALFAIRDELQHVFYHLVDPDYFDFDHLLENGRRP